MYRDLNKIINSSKIKGLITFDLEIFSADFYSYGVTSLKKWSISCISFIIIIPCREKHPNEENLL